MKKIVGTIVLLMFILIGLVGCNNKSNSQTTSNITSSSERSNSKEITKNQIRNYTIMADATISKIFGSKNIDVKNTIKKDGQSGSEYGKSINYKSKDIVKKNLMNYFDENGIDEFLDNMIIEKNGELYLLIGQAGVRPDLKKSDMKLTRKENEIKIEFTSGSEDNNIKENMTLIFKDNKWIFKNPWYTN